jgi:dTDP-4-dehydrorhamnose reductase
VIDDQIGAPTGADLLADITAHAIRHLLPPQRHNDLTLSGIYHLAPRAKRPGMATHASCWSARSRRAALRAGPAQVQPIPTSALPHARPRPHNSRLDTTRLQNDLRPAPAALAGGRAAHAGRDTVKN